MGRQRLPRLRTNSDPAVREGGSSRGRVRWDWLAPLASVLVVLTVLEFWWSFYRIGRADGWASYGQFLPLVAQLFVMFLLASAALPDEVPEAGNGVFAAALVSLAIIRRRGYHTTVIVLMIVVLGLSWSRLRLS